MQEKAHQPVGGVSGAGDEQEQRDQLEERRLAPVGRGNGNGEGAERSSGTADPEGGQMSAKNAPSGVADRAERKQNKGSCSCAEYSTGERKKQCRK